MTENFAEDIIALRKLITKAKTIHEETYRAWVAQAEIEFPTYDTEGNYRIRASYKHKPSEKFHTLNQRHVYANDFLRNLKQAEHAFSQMMEWFK